MQNLKLNRYNIMKSNELLNQIKTLLNLKVNLEELKLENGTVVSAEEFQKEKKFLYKLMMKK